MDEINIKVRSENTILKKTIFISIAIGILICITAIYLYKYCYWSMYIKSDDVKRIEISISPERMRSQYSNDVLYITNKKDINTMLKMLNEIKGKKTTDFFYESATDLIRIFYNNGTCCEIEYKKPYSSKGLMSIQDVRFDNNGIHLLNNAKFYIIFNEDIEKIFNFIFEYGESDEL